MTDEQANRLEEKLDKLLELAPTIDALGSVLVRRNAAIERTGLSKNVFNDKGFEEIGKRKTFVEVSEIAAVKKREKRNR